MNLSVVIVNWNVRELLRKALLSLQASLSHARDLDWEVWVVDNASSDGSEQMLQADFPWVHTIPLQENIGFGAANNLALFAQGLLPAQSNPALYFRSLPLAQRLFGQKSSSSGPPDAVFFLNPDTEVVDGAPRRLLETLFANPHTGLVGPHLTYGNGRHQHSAFRFPGLCQVAFEFFPLHPRLYDTRLNGRYAEVLYRGRTAFPVDFVLGAAMVVRSAVIREVGAFDEGYWLYAEEMDWARRIRAAGWEIRLDPQAHVVHHEGQSSRRFRERAFVALWESRLRYFRLYHGPLFNRAVHGIIRLGLYKRRWSERHLPPDERFARWRAYAQVEALLQGKVQDVRSYSHGRP